MRYLFNKIRRFYLYDLKLQNKLIVSHMLLILLPTVVLTLFLYLKLYDTIVSDTILTEQALAAQTTNTIEATLSQVVQASDSLAMNNSLINLFSETGSTLYSSTVASRVSSIAKTADGLTDGELITAIRIYVDDSLENVLDNSHSPLLQPLSSVTSTYWYGIFSSTDTSELFCPDLYLSVTEEEELGSLAYITKLDTGTDAEVYLAVYFSSDRLDYVLASNVTTENSAVYIINERDTVTAASSDTLSGAYYMSNETLSELVEGVNLYSTRTFLEESLYVGYFTISGTDWHLVSILSYDSLVGKGQIIVMQFMAIYFLFFVLALVVSIGLSHSIARRISRVISQMHTVHNARPSRIDVNVQAHDEIGMLVDTYNYMSDEINELLDQQARDAEELKLLEYKALQSQINPHFLYNSLDMINWQSQFGNSEEVTQSVQALSRFYKLTLSRKDTKAALSMEIEHVSLYVKLQNMRYENRIELLTDVPDSLLNYELPKLTLQPIVENSILHGIMERPEKRGSILITGWLENGDLVLMVSDDGVGMDADTLASILDENRKPGGEGSNIGIYNTHSRLRILYGAGYGLHYESTKGQGTEVYIKVPAIPADES